MGKVITFSICIAVAAAVALFAEWVEMPADSFGTILAPDSSGESRFDSVIVAEADTNIYGKIRPNVMVYYADGKPKIRREIGYCVSPDSTRRFFARCPEKDRWFEWSE
ncbi:hypothetical protein DRQ36_06540 [bacterium]|nr:MAG: hypothetical protein DRQ36_06540 [bacterium]